VSWRTGRHRATSLLHGFPEGAESWSKQVHALAGAGALAVAPDMRGYGLTDAPERVDDYTLTKLVDDVAGLVGAFGRKTAHIAGHDWGAMVAWFFAIAHPEMTRTLTVLSVGHPAALADSMRHEDQRTRSRYIDLFLLEGKAEQVLGEDEHRRLRGMLGASIPPVTVDHFVRSLSRPGRLTAGLNYYRANLSRDHPWTSLRVDTDVKSPTRIPRSAEARPKRRPSTSPASTSSRFWRGLDTGFSSSGRPR